MTRHWLTSLAVIVVLASMPHTSHSCPQSCTCQNSKVTCTHASFKDIFAGIPPGTRHLEIGSEAKINEGVSIMDIDLTRGGTGASRNLLSILIQNTALESIQDNTFSGMSDLHMLNLTSNKIKTISKHAFAGLHNLTSLDLSHNQIERMMDVLNDLTRLQSLDLSYNNINVIQTKTFKDQSALNKLNLNNNRLQGIHGYVFEGLVSLRHLSLRHCDLLSLDGDMFNVIRNIQVLDIGGNQIYQLPAFSDFRVLPSALQHLVVDNNQITRLVDSQFAGLNLYNLNLTRNVINAISGNVFDHFNVRVLDLSFNSITAVHENAFRPVSPQLEILSLAGNSLQHIPPRMFDNINNPFKLIYLNLSTCSLQKLADNQFQSLHSLRSLDISHNSLKNIPVLIAEQFRKLQELALHGNPWTCDCHIEQLRNYLKNQVSSILYCPYYLDAVSMSHCKDPRCTYPDVMLERKIKDLSMEDIKECESGTENKHLSLGAIVGIALACVVICVLLSICIMCVCRRQHHRVKRQLNSCHCGNNSTHSSHDDIERDKSTTPFKDNSSLNESDKDFVVTRYFNSMRQAIPSAVSRGTPSLSHKEFDFHGSLASLTSVNSVFTSRPVKYESAV